MTDGRELFNRVVAEYKRLVRFPNDWTYDMVALFVMQAYIKDALKVLTMLAFIGPKESGKTTALEIAAEMCNGNGQAALSGNMSAAVIARLAKDHVLFIDELDELKGEAYDVALGVLRTGYRRGGSYMRVEGKNLEAKIHDTFGPKAYSLRGETEDALTSRTYMVRTEGIQDSKEIQEKKKLNYLRDMSGLASDIAAWATPERVKTFKSEIDEYMANGVDADVERMGISGGPRDYELAVNCLAIGHVLGLDLVESIKMAMADQYMFQDGLTDEFRAELYTLWNGLGKPPVVKRA